MMTERLTPNGESRRRQIKADLRQQVAGIRREHQRRKRRLVAAAICGVATCLLASGWIAARRISGGGLIESAVAMDDSNNRPSAHPASAQGENEAREPTPQPENALQYIQQSDVEIESIDDAELLQLLALAGRPSTLARIDGQLVLLPQQHSIQ